MEKGLSFAILLLIGLSIFAGISNAQEFPGYSNKYVNDFAGIFDENEIGALKELLAQVDQNTTAEMVVVTINTTAPYAPSEYRTKLFNYWKIGKPEKDNGLLIVYAVSEKRIEVEVGYGLEGVLPDSKVGRMLDDYYVPLRDSGKTKEGIIAFTQETAKVINENREEVLEGNIDVLSGTSFLWIIATFIIIFLILFFIFTRARKRAEAAVKLEKSAPYKEVKDKNRGKRTFVDIMLFVAVFVLFIGAGEELSTPFIIIAIILIIFGGMVVNFLLPPRCSKDGSKLKFWKNEGKYKLYRCDREHVMRIAAAAAGGIVVGGLGGHGGGGFGGGGFGGGMSGGGGAGR